MRRMSLVMVVALAAVCVPLGSAAGQEAREPEGQDEVPPVLSLLGHRERLSLASEQIAALDSIAREWDVENERLTLRGGTMMSSGIGGTTVSRARASVRSRPEAAANNLRAARAVEAVLTPEQRRLVCEMPSPRRAGTRSPWPWCNAGSPES